MNSDGPGDPGLRGNNDTPGFGTQLLQEIIQINKGDGGDPGQILQRI